MKVKAFAIAGALSVLSIAVCQSAKAQAPYEFWYAYSGGAFATLCDLHMNDEISTNTLQLVQKNFMGNGAGHPAAKKEAVNAVLAQAVFKDCPLRRY